MNGFQMHHSTNATYCRLSANGPTLFYDDSRNFLMEVKPGIVVNFYEDESNSTKPVAKVVLKERATSVKVRTSMHSLIWRG